MKLQFIGSGDAFGSGGRFNTCFHVTGSHINFLIDCGASSLIALKKNLINLNDIQTIFITHFHADHFGGIPFFILDSQFFSKRQKPLTIVGPNGLANWYKKVMEVSFPGSSKTKLKFEFSLVEINAGEKINIDNVVVESYQAQHGILNGPFLSYRLTAGEKVISYTGDTESTDDLIHVGKEADIFIAEAYFFDKLIPYHLNLASIVQNLPKIKPKRLILTHMSDDMLGMLKEIKHEVAFDGMNVFI